MFKPIFPGLALIVFSLIGAATPVHVANAEVQWEKSIEIGMKTAAKTGKLVMMDFYADW